MRGTAFQNNFQGEIVLCKIVFRKIKYIFYSLMFKIAIVNSIYCLCKRELG